MAKALLVYTVFPDVGKRANFYKYIIIQIAPFVKRKSIYFLKKKYLSAKTDIPLEKTAEN